MTKQTGEGVSSIAYGENYSEPFAVTHFLYKATRGHEAQPDIYLIHVQFLQGSN